MKFAENVLKAIGNTPLVKLNKLVGPDDATVLVKLEFMNPGGSIKDRMALHIIEKAEKSGALKPGGTIVENTSGNTGFGVAMVAAVKGYKCIFTMPDKMSQEKINALKAMGAEVVVTPTNVPAEDPRSYYETSKRIARETPNSFMLNQYHNKDNIEAHYSSTGPEIWEQTQGELDYFVAGLGTGGTMSGAGKFLKEKKPSLRNVGVDPVGSVYADYFRTGKLITPHTYKVEGIGEDMLCGAMDFKAPDDVRRGDNKMFSPASSRLTREEGIFAGGSSGGAVHVACELAREAGKGKIIIAVLTDGGRPYISKFYNDEWMKDNGFLEPKSAGGTVRDLVQKFQPKVISAHKGEKLQAVADRMKQHGISQMPVNDANGSVVGMIHEIDLLNAMLAGKAQPGDAVDTLIAPLQGVVTPDTQLLKLKDVFAEDNVAVVKEGAKVTAIITKIDVIEYLSQAVR
ncbi:MAG: pyridoxal-phosphate dependent enzyme [Myxococcales bacterium]